jgi:hypothetical protein
MNLHLHARRKHLSMWATDGAITYGAITYGAPRSTSLTPRYQF